MNLKRTQLLWPEQNKHLNKLFIYLCKNNQTLLVDGGLQTLMLTPSQGQTGFKEDCVCVDGCVLQTKCVSFSSKYISEHKIIIKCAVLSVCG